MAHLDTDVLGEHLGILKGALLALGAPIEAMNSLKWIRDQFEVVQAGAETGPLAAFEAGAKPAKEKGKPTPETHPDQFTEDGFYKGDGDKQPITPIEQVPHREGRKGWTPEAKAAQAERQKARWAARRAAAGEAA